jgi:hypothetical protein
MLHLIEGEIASVVTLLANHKTLTLLVIGIVVAIAYMIVTKLIQPSYDIDSQSSVTPVTSTILDIDTSTTTTTSTPTSTSDYDHDSSPIPDVPKTAQFGQITDIDSRVHVETGSSLHDQFGYHSGIEPYGTTDWYPLDQLLIPEIDYNGHQKVVSQMGGGDDMRLNDVIYSGDLIEIRSGDNILQRSVDSSQILLDALLPEFRTNLSKLRLETLSGDGPIQYGENIYVKHTVLVDNKNQVRFIKYGERVQSHQEGPVYEFFKIINKNHPDMVGNIKYGDAVVLACGDQDGDKIYLTTENDKSISVESTFENSVVFTIDLLKPFDVSNLCICQGETIFP